MLTVSGKALGRRKPLFADFSIPFPPDLGDDSVTLRELIEFVVRSEVAAFRERQTERQLLKALTAQQIQEGANAGKIEMGDSEIELQNVDEESAIEAALQAFIDGMYLVSIDETQYRDLDEQIFIRDETRVTFIRLTLLAGG